MLYVRIKKPQNRDGALFHLDKPLRCYIHEIEKGREDNPRSNWFLVETKKRIHPWNSDVDPQVIRKFVDPEFPGFKNENGQPQPLMMEWMDGSECELIESYNNETASYLLLKDEDYINID